MQTLRSIDSRAPSAVRRFGVGFLVLLANVVVACKGDTPKPSTESAAPAAPAPAAAPAATSAAPALTIAYSDWPGWVAWDIGLKKGWFDAAGVKVDFKWFEYVPSMDAFSAGKVDAVAVTNGDALVTGANGGKSVCILANDYSNGNDMVVARPGIKSVAELKGKKVGVEVGFVSHLLLLNALASANLKPTDVTLVNVPTDQTPQLLKSRKVDAIVAWQPNSGAALTELPGSTPIFTSANAPGIIYDLLCVAPKSLAERRSDWKKVVKVWDRVAKYILDEKTVDDAARIMAARVGLRTEAYRALMRGTAFLDLAGASKHWKDSEGFESIYGSSRTVDVFNVKNQVYKNPLKVDAYLDPSLSEELVANR